MIGRAWCTLVYIIAVAFVCQAQTYTIATAAGGARPYYLSGTGDGGQAASAALGNPCYDAAADSSGNLYIAAGGLIRKVTPTGTISTVAGGGKNLGEKYPALESALSPTAITVDSTGDILIADAAYGQYRIRKVDTTGTIATIAGGGACCALGDGGPAIGAYLEVPYGIALDGAGNLYIAQVGATTNLIRKVSANGIISTVAGGGSALGDGGPATGAMLTRPTGVAVDRSGNIYIADTGANRVRKVSNGIITTVAGTGAASSSGDGSAATQAGVDQPWHVAVDSSANLFITQFYDARVRMVTPGGTIGTIAGNGTAGYSGDGGPAANAEVDQPAGITVTAAGIYIADDNPATPRVRLLSLANSGNVTVTSSPVGLSATLDAGTPCTTPCTFSLAAGSAHTIAVPSPEAGAAGTQYVFSNWSDGGAISHSITVPSSPTTYTASFQTQYQLTISASPAAGGTVTPASGGFYNAAAAVNTTAAAASGYVFTGWTGSVANPSSASTTVTMSAPETVTAGFTVQGLTGLAFYPLTPCRVADTRNANGTFGGPALTGGGTRVFPISSSPCGVPSAAQAYSLNVTVVPPGPMGYLTIWPTGQAQPLVSTLNSYNGAILANAAIVPAGASGNVSVFVSDTTNLILDINGYFAPPAGAGALAFYPAAPCRVADTRNPNGAFGGPPLTAGATRNFTVPASSCGIPSTAQAYSLNMTVVPPAALGYLTTWPAGQTQPYVSTLNALQGQIAANAAIVPAGANGAISVFASDASNVIVDINGYFAPPGSAGALYFYPVTPCRIADTRNAAGTFGGPALGSESTRSFPIPSSACGLPSTAQAYSLNLTVVPPGPLLYLTTWPAGLAQPVVSTLNDLQGQVVANAAIVPAGTGPSGPGAISVYVSDATNLIVDVNGYFGQ